MQQSLSLEANSCLASQEILCSSLKVRDQVSHPYKTIGKIKILYILIFTFLDSRCGR
jgi:hypothetical protein